MNGNRMTLAECHTAATHINALALALDLLLHEEGKDALNARAGIVSVLVIMTEDLDVALSRLEDAASRD